MNQQIQNFLQKASLDANLAELVDPDSKEIISYLQPWRLLQEAEMSSEESDVELDMDLVLAQPDPDEPHEMGDPNKKGKDDR
jgi:hypothetical protein